MCVVTRDRGYQVPLWCVPGNRAGRDAWLIWTVAVAVIHIGGDCYSSRVHRVYVMNFSGAVTSGTTGLILLNLYLRISYFSGVPCIPACSFSTL